MNQTQRMVRSHNRYVRHLLAEGRSKTARAITTCTLQIIFAQRFNRPTLAMKAYDRMVQIMIDDLRNTRPV